MYRIALGVMLGISSLLIAYGQFRALPGQENSLDLTATVRDALIVCVSSDTSELCPFPLNPPPRAALLAVGSWLRDSPYGWPYRQT
jgi:hypothetical protein